MPSSSLGLRKAAAMLPAAFFLSGCMISLVPDYDAAVVDGLQRTHEKTMILFTSIASDERKGDADAPPKEVFRRSIATFPTHAKSYDEIIGTFAALKTRADARIVPPLTQKVVARLAEKNWLKQLCGTEDRSISSCVNPTPRTIDNIIRTISGLKNSHKNLGLGYNDIAIFRNEYITFTEQALTVENALKRD